MRRRPGSQSVPSYPWGLPKNMILGPVRGVVTFVHFPDDETNRHGVGIEVDVLTYDRGFLSNVPVAAYGGAGDADLWVPQPAVRALNGEAITYDPADPDGFEEWAGSFATPVNELDGDHVLVVFCRGRNSEPVVIARVAHPRALRTIGRGSQAVGSELHPAEPGGSCWHRRQAGVRQGVDPRGNWYLDTRQAGSPNDNAGLDEEGDDPKRAIFIQGNANSKIVIRLGDDDETGGKVIIEGTKVTVDLPTDGEFEVTRGGAAGSEILDAAKVEAHLAEIRFVVASLIGWSHGVDAPPYEGPSVPSPGDLRVPGVAVPSS